MIVRAKIYIRHHGSTDTGRSSIQWLDCGDRCSNLLNLRLALHQPTRIERLYLCLTKQFDHDQFLQIRKSISAEGYQWLPQEHDCTLPVESQTPRPGFSRKAIQPFVGRMPIVT